MSHKEARAELLKEYFPNTKKCQLESGADCIKDKCKYWIDDRSCWDTKFDELVREVFQTDDYFYIHFMRRDDEKSWPGYFNFTVRAEIVRYYGDKKTDLSTPPQMLIEIWLNSERLASMIQKKFNLVNWEIESKSEDGGDDHALALKTNASHLERDRVVELLKSVKDLANKILEYEKEANTCRFCRRKAEHLFDYGKWSICSWCRKSIIMFFVNNPICRFLFRFLPKQGLTHKDLNSSC
jgi:hypothetical protein